MAEKDERLRCRYCGSNNFAGTTTCWQCNRPLIGLSVVSTPESQAQRSTVTAGSPYPAFSQIVNTQAGDRAAIALGLLFPLFGYPIGLAFIMLDDARKVQLGKLAILWSTIGLVVSVVLSLILLAPLAAIMKQVAPSNSLSHLSLPSSDDN